MAQLNITDIPSRTGNFPTANLWRIANPSQAAERIARWTMRRGADECWPWAGPVAKRYGRARMNLTGQKGMCAARVVYALHHSTPIPKRMVIAHSCDNPGCVNPRHLFLVTQAENMHDSVRKGRKNCWGHQKLTAGDVSALRAEYAAGGITQKALGAKFGVARNTVSQIVRGLTWKHLLTNHARSLPASSSADKSMFVTV